MKTKKNVTMKIVQVILNCYTKCQEKIQQH